MYLSRDLSEKSHKLEEKNYLFRHDVMLMHLILNELFLFSQRNEVGSSTSIEFEGFKCSMAFFKQSNSSHPHSYRTDTNLLLNTWGNSLLISHIILIFGIWKKVSRVLCLYTPFFKTNFIIMRLKIGKILEYFKNIARLRSYGKKY